MNIDYHTLVRQRAALLTATNKAAEARKEVQRMRGDLAKRKVNEPVLKAIDAFADTLG